MARDVHVSKAGIGDTVTWAGSVSACRAGADPAETALRAACSLRGRAGAAAELCCGMTRGRSITGWSRAGQGTQSPSGPARLGRMLARVSMLVPGCSGPGRLLPAALARAHARRPCAWIEVLLQAASAQAGTCA